MAQLVKNLLAVKEMRETWVRSLGQEDPQKEGMASHSSTLLLACPGESHGQTILASYSPWGRKELDS